MEFKKNDVVVVVSSVNRRTENESKYTICKVTAVGKFDLICEKLNIVYKKHFKVSKKRCYKVNMVCNYNHLKTVDPKIGDLVLSVSDRFDNESEEITGIVEKIVYDPVDQTDYVYYVRTGQKIERCYLKNLIILEHS